MSVMQDLALDANGRWIKCVLNAKFIVFHMNFGKYLNLGTSENFSKNYLSDFVFFKEFFLDKNIFSDNRTNSACMSRTNQGSSSHRCLFRYQKV